MRGEEDEAEDDEEEEEEAAAEETWAAIRPSTSRELQVTIMAIIMIMVIIFTRGGVSHRARQTASPLAPGLVLAWFQPGLSPARRSLVLLSSGGGGGWLSPGDDRWNSACRAPSFSDGSPREYSSVFFCDVVLLFCSVLRFSGPVASVRLPTAA